MIRKNQLKDRNSFLDPVIAIEEMFGLAAQPMIQEVNLSWQLFATEPKFWLTKPPANTWFYLKQPIHMARKVPTNHPSSLPQNPRT